MMGKRVAIHPILMMIAILAGVPFKGFVGFILGPVLMALLVTVYKLYTEAVSSHASKKPDRIVETPRVTGSEKQQCSVLILSCLMEKYPPIIILIECSCVLSTANVFFTL